MPVRKNALVNKNYFPFVLHEFSTAPGCGAIIGGQSHVSAAGNRSFQASKLRQRVGFTGYRVEEAGHYLVTRAARQLSLSQLTISAMRCVLHLLLVVLAGGEQGTTVEVAVALS